MGAWGYAPWDDDSAADWFGELFDEIPLASKVEEALSLDPEECAAEIRAAASLLVMLGRTYVWPIDNIDRHLELAIAQMEKVRAVYEDEPEFSAAVAEEIAILRSRRANAKDAPIIDQPASWGNFWT
ncbi:MAG: DUF4259 domain-containing protein [Planctomycetota bacterium]|nr:MAG: DUF4259 domain-containing protein [Planctomycetota bacterium]REK26456.1 MAG: DUF4259 domain-containing protein [Planctomycetota bacterium]REK38707.1 MAG: DUF4259 domain-containing protein [Planctomycetota bacterium]